MNATHDMSLISLVMGASLPVQVVMAILLLTSLMSWWYIFIKFFTVNRAEDNADTFEDAFWSGGDLNKLYEGINSGKGRRKPQGMASIFEAGFKEFVCTKNIVKKAIKLMSAMSWKAQGVRCVPITTEKWMSWTLIYLF